MGQGGYNAGMVYDRRMWPTRHKDAVNLTYFPYRGIQNEQVWPLQQLLG